MVTTQQNLTFDQYLTYDDGPDHRYQLVRGELVLMTPPHLSTHIYRQTSGASF
jgi:Uma2 family endonuclease